MKPEFTFRTEPLSVILSLMRDALQAGGEVVCLVPDPDLGTGLYAGEVGAAGVHRPLSAWVDVADVLGAHLLTPERAGEGLVRLRFLSYAKAPEPDAHGYGPHTAWARVNKLEDPVFLTTFTEALRRVNPPAGGRVLALGVNAGHELAGLKLAFPEREFTVVGLDVDGSALQAARTRWTEFEFLQQDVNALPLAELGHFDLIVALSLLQSPGVRQDVLLAALCRHHLNLAGGLILGYPNARYRDGTLSYGARMRNYARPDFSLLMADVTDARRNLHKRGFKVFVTGKYEVIVTAIPAQQPTPRDLK